MDDQRETGKKLASEMFDAGTAEALAKAGQSSLFGVQRGDMALRFVLGEVWARPGLARRDKSLVTLGMLIALRQMEEFEIHVGAAVRNGLSVQEIEEVIYQALPYAGFPAASQAAIHAAKALKAQGLIPA